MTSLAIARRYRTPASTLRIQARRPSAQAAEQFLPFGAERNGPAWHVSAICPPDWRDAIERCGGGVFHTPVGLRLAVGSGEARFFSYGTGDAPPIAVALAVLRGCRLSLRLRHAEFASAPALAADCPRADAEASLRNTLTMLGVAEANIGSFDADSALGGDAPGRVEFRVPLEATDDERLARCCSQHRRHIRRGNTREWDLRFLTGQLATDAIGAVQAEAAQRAERRGDGFAPASPSAAGAGARDFRSPWGAATIGAYDGTRLLAAAVIGWANHRAFYISGGSTPEGYAEGAAAWMHWRAMTHFREAGGTRYNLGGVPATASDAGDPSHGLYRFKEGFGAEPVRCASSAWVMSPSHQRSHTVGRWIAGSVVRT